MADADLIWPARQSGLAAASPLFERLPDRLFAPLSSPNRHSYWALLCRLHERRFGPDAPLPPSEGFLRREIIREIEDELQTQDEWEGEEGLTPETPIGVRANTVLGRLEEAGWLKTERYILEMHITMRPAVSQFLSMLIEFAQTGPVFVSAKIRSIDTNIQQVLEGAAGGDTLADTATQARNLLVHVRNTGTNVRDIMEALNSSESTAQYVRRFFTDYIERVFIGDYRELRTREHPLSRRSQILYAVDELSNSEEHRARLIGWYEAKRCAGNRARAESLFENDIHRLMDLRRIDEYLDRLDDEIRRANRRALAVLNHQLRSPHPVEASVKHAIACVLQARIPPLSDPFPAGNLVSAAQLSEPRKSIERAPPSALRKSVPSPESIALERLRLRARELRMITTPKLAMLVQQALAGSAQVASDALLLTTVRGVRLYQTLSTIALRMGTGNPKHRDDALAQSKGFRVGFNGQTDPPQRPINGPQFVVIRPPRLPPGVSGSRRGS